jgi:hypothetical protein
MSTSFLSDEEMIRMSEEKPHRYLTIKCEPALVERINELANADRRSRINWLTMQIERLASQGPQELPEERSAA